MIHGKEFLESMEPGPVQIGRIRGMGFSQFRQRKRIKSEDPYRVFFDKSVTATVVVEEDTTISLINEEAEKLFGYSKEEIEGKRSWTDFVLAEDLERMKSYHQLRRENPSAAPQRYEFRFKDRKGQIRHAHLTVAMIPGTRKSRASLTDFTDLKKAQGQQEELLAQLESIMENTDTHLAYLDRDFNFVRVNTAYADGSGYRKEDMVGRNHFQIFPNEENESIFRRVRDTGTPVMFNARPFRYHNQPWKGTTYWDWSLVPVSDETGRVQGLVLSLQDVTGDVNSRRRIEKLLEQLQGERGRLESVILNIPLGIVVADPEARIVSANPAADRILGRPVPIGRSYDDQASLQMCFPDGNFPPPHDLPLVRSALNGERFENLEMAVIHPDGTRKDLLVTTGPVTDRNGEVLGAVGTFQDITERKMMEDALRRNEARYRHIVEDQTEMICRFQPGGRLTFVNEAYCRYFSKPREELIGQRFLQYMPDSERERFEERFASLNPENSLLNIEQRIVLPDGEVRWQRWTIRAVFDRKGKFREHQATGRDVTELIKAEEDLKKAHDELEFKVRERTSLLAETNRVLLAEIADRKAAEEKILASHQQLRSLTSELIMTEERERRRISGELHDHIGQTLAAAKIKLEGLRELADSGDIEAPLAEIRDLIGRSIQDTRLLMMQLSPPVLYELGFAAAVEWLAEQVQGQHGLLIDCECDSGLDSLEEDVEVLLFQSTRELLLNAVKHAKAAKALVKVSGGAEEVTIEVQDDGVGFQVSQITPMPDGTGGFGLFSIRERLHYYGGGLDIQSRPGEGTRVTIKVPREIKRKKKRRGSYEH